MTTVARLFEPGSSEREKNVCQRTGEMGQQRFLEVEKSLPSPVRAQPAIS